LWTFELYDSNSNALAIYGSKKDAGFAKYVYMQDNSAKLGTELASMHTCIYSMIEIMHMHKNPFTQAQTVTTE
jgi:hypothetical protein